MAEAWEAVWAHILRTLRTEKNFALFGLLSTMNDVTEQDGQICLHAHNDAEKNLLTHHLPLLQKLAEPTPLVVQDDTQTVQDDNRDTIARLKDLFGDKVEII
ncbi:MAG: hypothetical protein NC133_03080 [Prevotella sp.]|nr:hypothetical protein [Prevotella sp.]